MISSFFCLDTKERSKEKIKANAARVVCALFLAPRSGAFAIFFKIIHYTLFIIHFI